MKKLVAIALLVASLCVVGCNDNTKPLPSKTPTGGAPTTPAGK
ncbi:MAG: hypothetical protein QM703_00435 [Gemmatales bacterium]